MFVLDTSGIITGWRAHYRPSTFPAVWDFIDSAIESGDVVVPRAVFVELSDRDDDVYEWLHAREQHVIFPDEATQVEAGRIQATHFSVDTVHDQADPWVIAEAKTKGFSVVTYEGVSPSGAQSRQAHKKMPGICSKENVGCSTLSGVFDGLGARFG